MNFISIYIFILQIFIFHHKKCAYFQEWKILSMFSSRFFFKFHCIWRYTAHLYWVNYACLEVWIWFIYCLLYLFSFSDAFDKNCLVVCERVCCVCMYTYMVYANMRIWCLDPVTHIKWLEKDIRCFPPQLFTLFLHGFSLILQLTVSITLPVQKAAVTYLSPVTALGL